MSDGGSYVSVISGEGLDDGDVFTHGILPFVVCSIEEILYELRILEPDEGLSREDGHVFGAFHTFGPVVGIGSHVVVNVDEVGGDVVGNHSYDRGKSEGLRVVWMDWISNG